jgi:hypothetical protein
MQPFYRRTGAGEERGGGARRGTTEGGATGTRPQKGFGVTRASWVGAGYGAQQIAGSRPGQ